MNAPFTLDGRGQQIPAVDLAGNGRESVFKDSATLALPSTSTFTSA